MTRITLLRQYVDKVLFTKRRITFLNRIYPRTQILKKEVIQLENECKYYEDKIKEHFDLYGASEDYDEKIDVITSEFLKDNKNDQDSQTMQRKD